MNNLKFSVFNTILSIVLVAAAAFLVYDQMIDNPNVWAYTLGCYFSLLFMLIPTIGFSTDNSRVNVYLKVCGVIGLIIMAILNTVLIVLTVSTTVYFLILVALLVIHFSLLKLLFTKHLR